MDARKYIPAGSSVSTLASLEHTEVGRIIIHALRVESERRSEAIQRRPMVNTEDVREDVRHKLGEIDGLKWLERLHRAAKDAESGGGKRPPNEEDGK